MIAPELAGAARPRSPFAGRAGFTVLEVVIAVTIMAVIGYGLALAADVGQRSQREVMDGAASNSDLRQMVSRLADELRTCDANSLIVTTLGDGNSEVTLQEPVALGGAFGWGVSEPLLGSTDAEKNRFDWSLRYTVVSVPEGTGVRRELRRQLLDDSGVVQRQEVVVSGLRSGGAAPEGFSVTPVGDLWRVVVTCEGVSPDNPGHGVRFDVHNL